jgi:hypothetical protein
LFLLSSFCSFCPKASVNIEIDQRIRTNRDRPATRTLPAGRTRLTFFQMAVAGTGMALGGWLGGFLFDLSGAYT